MKGNEIFTEPPEYKIEDIINLYDLGILRNEISFQCSICKNILINPVLCTICQCSFCNNCVKINSKCPNECQRNYFIENKMIKKFLSKLKFICKNGCGIEIEYNQIKDHYLKECPKLIADQNEEEKNKNKKTGYLITGIKHLEATFNLIDLNHYEIKEKYKDIIINLENIKQEEENIKQINSEINKDNQEIKRKNALLKKEFISLKEAADELEKEILILTFEGNISTTEEENTSNIPHKSRSIHIKEKENKNKDQEVNEKYSKASSFSKPFSSKKFMKKEEDNEDNELENKMIKSKIKALIPHSNVYSKIPKTNLSKNKPFNKAASFQNKKEENEDELNKNELEISNSKRERNKSTQMGNRSNIRNNSYTKSRSNSKKEYNKK